MRQAKRLMLLIMLMPLLTLAQMQGDNKGIQWTTGLSWEQVKQKAKQDNKYIFMDCYATWCVPCKKMDKETYPDEKVGALVNENFIAVKVQMDSTGNDTEPTQKWYPAVKEIKKNYTIPGYPAYLFFSPEGELVHQDVGYKPVKDFVVLVNDALNPVTQLAKIMEQYKTGALSPSSLGKAALAEKKLGKKDLADSIARKYKAEFLDKLPDSALFTKENIQFLASDFYLLMWEDGTKGRLFNFFLYNPKLVDSLFGKEFAESRVKNIITKYEINPKLLNGKKVITQNPDWEGLRKSIAAKYGSEYAEQVVSEYQPTFYLLAGNWQKWADLFKSKLRRNPPKKGGRNLDPYYSDATILNQTAWGVFLHCNDRKVLRMAIKWSELSIKLIEENRALVNYLDTKANLLYKLGKAKKAINTEKTVLDTNRKLVEQYGNDQDQSAEFNKVLEKMKAGIPTWK